VNEMRRTTSGLFKLRLTTLNGYDDNADSGNGYWGSRRQWGLTCRSGCYNLRSKGCILSGITAEGQWISLVR